MTARPAGAFGTLDAADAAQVREYERHFYLAYARLADNKLVRLIWDWDDPGQRLRTRTPLRRSGRLQRPPRHRAAGWPRPWPST